MTVVKGFKVQALEMEAFQSNLEERQTLANIQIPPSKVAIYFK